MAALDQISLADLKAHKGQSGGGRDDILPAAITAASRLIEDWLEGAP